MFFYRKKRGREREREGGREREKGRERFLCSSSKNLGAIFVLQIQLSLGSVHGNNYIVQKVLKFDFFNLKIIFLCK